MKEANSDHDHCVLPSLVPSRQGSTSTLSLSNPAGRAAVLQITGSKAGHPGPGSPDRWSCGASHGTVCILRGKCPTKPGTSVPTHRHQAAAFLEPFGQLFPKTIWRRCSLLYYTRIQLSGLTQASLYHIQEHSSTAAPQERVQRRRKGRRRRCQPHSFFLANS